MVEVDPWSEATLQTTSVAVEGYHLARWINDGTTWTADLLCPCVPWSSNAIVLPSKKLVSPGILIETEGASVVEADAAGPNNDNLTTRTADGDPGILAAICASVTFVYAPAVVGA